MRQSAETIRRKIEDKIPNGACVPAHTGRGHFYKVGDNTYSSVTTKLQVIKDESLINYKMNRALDYVYTNYKGFNENNITQELLKAKEVSADILEDAGDVGSIIHECRERYFTEWITTGIRPADILSFIPEFNEDRRIVSALRALNKFIDDHKYVPIKTELLVWSDKLKVAGTLDDIGIMDGELVLLDLKTSNQFKDHYFFQVALYYKMFTALTKLRVKKCLILKVSKDDGTYKLEDLKEPGKLARYAENMIKTEEAIGYIKSLRKDNQKVVLKF